MNRDIEVGEYVRTESGISKVIENVDKYVTDKQISVDFICGMYHQVIYKRSITKHSKNIIDLIEVGDYVNGYKAEEVMEEMGTWKRFLEMTSNYTNKEIGDCTIREDKDIKTILTKEQYENNCYRLEE